MENANHHTSSITTVDTPMLIRDRHWAGIDSRACKITRFTPLAKVESGQVVSFDRTTPYAFVELEARELPPSTTGAITHKLDFQHLWEAFVERGVDDDEEVVIFWRKEHLRWLARPFSMFMPGLVVWVCKAGAWELLTDQKCQPELQGRARFLAERPIARWEPEVLR
jgi:hypothetical protein